MKKYATVKAQWNNIQFYPEKEGLWYREEEEGIVCSSHIRYGNKTLSLSYFTYDDDFEELQDGWSATVYQNHESLAHRGLSTKDHIQAKDVNEAEDIAMEWSKIENVVGVQGNNIRSRQSGN
jgi:hypothetical protein